MAVALPPRLRPLLLQGAYRAAAAPRQGVGDQAGPPRQPRAAVLFHLPPGEGAPAAGRLRAPQGQIATPRRAAAREPAHLLSAAAVGGGRHACPAGRLLSLPAPHP